MMSLNAFSHTLGLTRRLMKRAFLACLFLCPTPKVLLSQANPVPSINQTARVTPPISASQTDPKTQAKLLDSYGKLPLSFEANHGQTDAKVRFLSRTGGFTLFLTGDEAVLAVNGKKADPPKTKIANRAQSLQFAEAATKAGGVLRMKLRNANPAAKVTGTDELTGKSNYFIGKDSTKWRTNVPTYAKVKFEGIYSGIDLVYYGNQRQLEYDFIIAPGADPRRITFDVGGAKWIRKNAHGELVFKVSEDEIRWHKPVVYQETDGVRHEIAAHYAIRGKNRVGFELAKYDASRPLYIDPLVYSTYLGSNSFSEGNGIAVDSSGDAYVTGFTGSNFPLMNPQQPDYGGGGDAYVTKFNPSGSALVYSTYLGGNAYDIGYGIAVDSSGDAYVTGYTQGGDFPVTPGALQTNFGGGQADAFVTMLNPTGSALLYSTYLGGSGLDAGYGVAVDNLGNAHVTGGTNSTDFPVTPGAFQTACGGKDNCQYGTAFVAEFNVTGSALVYSTYLGGNYDDAGTGIAVDSSGNVYVTGGTNSTNFPTTPGAFQPTLGGNGNAFVAKFNPTGSALVYSTYLGGSGGDGSSGIALDGSGSAYVTGYTGSNNFPSTPGAFQTTCGSASSCDNTFVTKFNPSGSALVYSTYLGGSIYDYGYGIAVDNSGDVYVTGFTESTNFPTTPGALQTTYGGGVDAFVTEFNPTGSALLYSTYLGGNVNDYGYGIALDSSGDAYVTGFTQSTNFPTTPGAFQTTYGGYYDAFVSKIYAIATVGTAAAIASSSNPSVFEQSVTFTATVTPQGSGTPTGTIKFSDGSTTLGTSTLIGGIATFTTTGLAVGLHSINAVYSGDSNFGGSSASLNQKVNQASTTLTLVTSVNPSRLGQPVTFTATITPQYSGQASGTVTFKDGATTLGSGAVSGNLASLTTSSLAMGTHFMTAVYGGDSNFTGGTSETWAQVVTKAATATTLLSSMNPSVSGKPVTFTASVSSLAGGPTGKIQFMNGTTVLETLKLTSGSAKYTTSKLPLGANGITAVYEGDSDNSGSMSAPVDQIVLAATATALSCSPNPSTYGEQVTFAATVIPTPPDGESVNFIEGSTVLGTGTLSSGSAAFTTSTLPVGMSRITAVYGGDSNFAASTSKAVKQLVKK